MVASTWTKCGRHTGPGFRSRRLQPKCLLRRRWLELDQAIIPYGRPCHSVWDRDILAPWQSLPAQIPFSPSWAIADSGWAHLAGALAEERLPGRGNGTFQKRSCLRFSDEEFLPIFPTERSVGCVQTRR